VVDNSKYLGPVLILCAVIDHDIARAGDHQLLRSCNAARTADAGHHSKLSDPHPYGLIDAARGSSIDLFQSLDDITMPAPAR
jgi:hypothetical protein